MAAMNTTECVTMMVNLPQFSVLGGQYWCVLALEVLCAILFFAPLCCKVFYAALNIEDLGQPRIMLAKDGHKYYRLILPAFVIVSALKITSSYGIFSLLAPVIPSLANSFAEVLLRGDTLPCWIMRLNFAMGCVGYVIYSTFEIGYPVFRINNARHAVEFHGPRLLHLVIVPCYKEPIEELSRTLESIHEQTVPNQQIIVVMAMEDRDAQHMDTFTQLEALWAAKFPRGFWCSVHILQEGEVAGPGSNVHAAISFASTQLRRVAEDDKVFDPFEVLITKGDSDIDFAPNYLEQAEWTFRHQLDGRRMLYHAPTSHSRNFDESPALVQLNSMTTTVADVYDMASMVIFNPTYAHLSLTLGFCEEQGSWAPADEISEDFMQSYKACIVSGELVTKRVWCANCVGITCNISDRFKQACRHQWGITLSAWAGSMITESNIEFFGVYAAMSNITSTLFTGCCPALVALLPVLPQCYNIFRELAPLTQELCMVIAVSTYVVEVVKDIFRMLLIWNVVLREHAHQPRPSTVRIICHAMMSPMLQPFLGVLFLSIPQWHCAIRCFQSPTYAFWTTPKGHAVRIGSPHDKEQVNPLVAYLNLEAGSRSLK